jgi:hypothetical protein
LAIGAGAGSVFATSNTNFSQSISGVLGLDIVDGAGSVVASPSVGFSSVPFSMVSQSTTGTLGTSSQKIRVTNPTASPSWTASLAATGGNTSQWTGSGVSYDFNNATSTSGQMTINPTAGTITGVGSTTTTNVSLGAQASFTKNVKDSIDLMSAASGAQAPGQWDLTGIGVSQVIPAVQAAGSYSLQMTLTIS